MANNEAEKIVVEKAKRRLDHPIWRFASYLVVVGAIGVFLYGIIGGYRIFSVLTVIFFLMLWFLPQLWNWIEFVFSKRPSSRWGRFVIKPGHCHPDGFHVRRFNRDIGQIFTVLFSDTDKFISNDQAGSQSFLIRPLISVLRKRFCQAEK